MAEKKADLAEAIKSAAPPESDSTDVLKALKEISAALDRQGNKAETMFESQVAPTILRIQRMAEAHEKEINELRGALLELEKVQACSEANDSWIPGVRGVRNTADRLVKNQGWGNKAVRWTGFGLLAVGVAQVGAVVLNVPHLAPTALVGKLFGSGATEVIDLVA